MSIPPRTPAECFAAILQWLTRAVVARMGGEQLALPVIALIVDRIRRIKQRFATLAARVRDGLYVPRRAALPRRRPGQPPPPPDPLPQKFGWLLPLVPEAVGSRSQLEYLLRDPAMAALLAAAPKPMARALRPLCRMLGVTPPPILAPPPPPAPSHATPAAGHPAARPRRPRLRPLIITAPPPAPPIPHACGPPLPHPA